MIYGSNLKGEQIYSVVTPHNQMFVEVKAYFFNLQSNNLVGGNTHS